MNLLRRRAALAALLAASLAFSTGAHADSGDLADEPKISVSGTGTAELAPDLAIVTMAVRTEQPTARAALTENNTLVAAVIEALRAASIEARDMQTSGLSIQPRIVYPQPRNNNEAPKTVGYEVQNTLTVRIRDLSQVGAILDKSVTLGVNQGGSLSFTNDDPSEAIEQARIAAMTEAKAKAQTLAKAAGVSLGRLLSIDEHSSRPQPVMMMRGAMASAEMARDVPIASGENTYSVTVNAAWTIDQ